MRKGGGKAKGAQFERDICVRLSLWVSDGQQEDVFWRSAMSGGRSTVAATKGKRLAQQAGDITCIDPAGQPLLGTFFVECKFYRDLDYQGLLTGKGTLLNFWGEARRQSKQYNKIPMLIAKQNRLPTMVCLTKAGFEMLNPSGIKATLIVPRRNMYIIDALEFFNTFTPIRK